MFQRTELPDGPRVISARLPGSRSVSIAAYVLAGSRLEIAPTQAGVAHFMEHLTFKGTAGYPSIARDLRGGRGRRRLRQRRHRPRVDRLLGPRPAPRGGARRWRVLGELIVRPHARRRRHRPGADRHRRGDPLVPRRPVRVRPDAHPAGDVRRGPAGPRDLRRRGRHPRAADARPSATSGARCTGPRTRSSPSPATSSTRRPSRWPPAAFGTGQRRAPGRSSRRPALPAGPRVLTGKRDTSQAQLVDRRPGAAPRPSRRVDARRSSTPCSATGCRAGCSSRVREEKGLAYDVELGDRRVRGLRARSRSRPGVDPDQLPAAIEAILVELVRLRRRARARRASSRRRRRTCRAASSCGWTTRATSRRGSAARRRSTTGCSRSTRRSPRSRRVRSGGRHAAGRRAVPRRGAPDGRRRPGARTCAASTRHLRLPR